VTVINCSTLNGAIIGISGTSGSRCRCRIIIISFVCTIGTT